MQVMKAIPKCIIVILLFVSSYSCKTQQLKLVFLEEKELVEVEINSGCRNSGVSPIVNEEELKNAIHNSAIASIKKLKLRTNKEIQKSTLKTNKIEYIINETCLTSNNNQVYSYKIRQVLSIENILSKEIFIFESDTLINNQQLNTNQLAVKKVDIAKYISPLTESNYMKAKNYFRQKK